MTMKAARTGAIRWGGFSVPMEPERIDRYVDAGLGADPDPDTRAWLLLIRASAGLRWAAFHRNDPVELAERVHAGEEARDHATKTGDETVAANAIRTIGSLLMAHGDAARGLELMRALIDMAPGIADPRERHLLTTLTANSLVWSRGDGEAMVETLLEALQLGRELRVHDHCHSTGTLLNALYLTGRWDEIPGYLDEHIAAFKTDEAGTTCPFALGAFPLGATVLAHRGETEQAREIAGQMPKSEAPVGILEGLQATAANALGDPATARAIAERVLATGARNFAEEPPVELAAMLDALVALQDWDAVRAFLPEARRRAAELALAGPGADRAEGLAAAASGETEHARALLWAAIDGFDRVSPFEAARSREALAAIDPARRQELLAAALATYVRLGAKPHAERIRSATAS